ncbi:proteasome component region PCI domain-containing protein [Heterostelium album PN500]|uniref:Eukaryotic translation initiation factor 3 subunit C n=1 Tax=Heterostelium pallidum (strain ATCC 26659 / Pp 5 / PN500) TaxID=670386 RepID=D3BBM5_HETP5|nr:proteasome component region PCI domain-containing protein [Heterostelium album PN500]EFA81058.1 proteasome component region PCI domain-containing protein [Heterostelium album PN500]|eukprot:XP_020433176.1 proteasome component region PCI domain-containing protein [Heterostelium album PN500]
MSRFFVGSSSESESDSSSSDSDVQVVPKRRVISSSEDEVDVKRVVRSAKDKLWIQLEEILQATKQQIAANEWANVQTGFETMMKSVDKSTALIKKEGVPPALVKTLYLIESGLAIDEAIRKKLSQRNSKAHTFLKQKIKKTTPPYEAQIKPYRENPELLASDATATKKPANDDSESEDDDESSDDDTPKKPTPAASKKAAPAKKPAGGWFKKGSDDSDSGFSSDSEDETSSDDSSYSDSDEDTGSKWWVKDTGAKATTQTTKKDKKKEPKKVVTPQVESTTTAATAGAAPAVQRQLTQEEITKKLKEILSSRGKKGTSPSKQVEDLEFLLTQVKTEKETFDILYNLINAQFDLSPNLQTSLALPVWKSCSDNILRLLDMLNTNKHFILCSDNEEPKLKEGEVVIRGNLLSLFERLDDEFTKSLQHLHFPSAEYTARLADEPVLLKIGESVQDYLEQHDTSAKSSRAAIRRLEHLYHRADPTEFEQNDKLIKRLSSYIYQHGDERLNARTILCNIYFNAIHNRFHEARDMMLMSHLQDNPTVMDILTQILFNRAMVQLGLCAFRKGYIQEAQQCLAEFSGLRKELLAQGASMHPKYQEKDPLKEIEEKQRILPGHLHIAIDVIETVNLLSGMLIAVPQTAARPFDSKLKTCKFFQRHMDHLDKQVFVPPPESFKDVIYASSKALATGDYRTTIDLLAGLKLWTVIQDAEAVRERLNRIIQEVSLKTFLFTYSAYYDTMLLSELADRFQLPKNHVHSIVSKMMANHEISASWEHSTETITFHRSEQTKLQYLALNYSDSLINFVEQNERIYDIKFGSYRNKKFDDVSAGAAQGQVTGGQQHHNQQRKQQRNNNRRQ